MAYRFFPVCVDSMDVLRKIHIDQHLPCQGTLQRNAWPYRRRRIIIAYMTNIWSIYDRYMTAFVLIAF